MARLIGYVLMATLLAAVLVVYKIQSNQIESLMGEVADLKRELAQRTVVERKKSQMLRKPASYDRSALLLESENFLYESAESMVSSRVPALKQTKSDEKAMDRSVVDTTRPRLFSLGEPDQAEIDKAIRVFKEQQSLDGTQGL